MTLWTGFHVFYPQTTSVRVPVGVRVSTPDGLTPFACECAFVCRVSRREQPRTP
jgi:hypothetical protein